jgi:hypothetical protein
MIRPEQVYLSNLNPQHGEFLLKPTQNSRAHLATGLRQPTNNIERKVALFKGYITLSRESKVCSAERMRPRRVLAHTDTVREVTRIVARGVLPLSEYVLSQSRICGPRHGRRARLEERV